MANGRFGSEHAALVALGNGLLLGYIIEAGLHAERVRRDKKEGGPGWGRPEEMRKASLECSERIDLRDALSGAGAWDPRVEGSAGMEELSFWDAPLEPLDAMFRRAQSLLRDEADIATLRLQDFAEGEVSLFPRWFLEWPSVRDALHGASFFELGRPLARLGPTPVTRALLPPLLAYFNGHVRECQHPGAAWFDACPQESAEVSARKPPEPAEAETKGGGPRARAAIGLERCAEAALKALGVANPGARMRKADFCSAVIAFMSKAVPGESFGELAAGRVWRAAALDEWKAAGKPGRRIHLLGADDLEPYLRAELNGRLQSQGPVLEPPAGSAWADLL